MTNLFKNSLHLTRKDFKIEGNDVIVINPIFKEFENNKWLIINDCLYHNNNNNKIIFPLAVTNGKQSDMIDIIETLGLKRFPTFYYVIYKEEGTCLIKEFDEELNEYLIQMI